MTTSGLFCTHSVEITAKIGEPFKFIPFGDVHRDSDMHSHTHWLEFLDYAKRQKNAIFLGMGDFTDGVSTSERMVLGDAGLHDTTRRTMEGVYKGVVKTLANELSFMRGRLMGLLGGNHYFDMGDGNTTDHLLASALNTRFLGVCAGIRLSVRLAGRGGKTISLDIWAHHGKGGGQLAGSTFNTVEKFSMIADGDIFLMGHDHAKGCIPMKPRLRLSGNAAGVMGVRERPMWLGRTGSFLKAYEPGRVSYNVDVGRAPCSLGWIEFEITPRRAQHRDGGDALTLDIRGTA